MLSETLKFKSKIDLMQKYWNERPIAEQPKMFVLCSTRMLPNTSIRTRLYNLSFIRPCNVSYKKYVAACKRCSSLNMLLDGSIFDIDFTKTDKSQFLLECAILGIMPQVEFIDDTDYKAVDEIDLTTGISFVDMRKKVLERRLEKQEKRKMKI